MLRGPRLQCREFPFQAPALREDLQQAERPRVAQGGALAERRAHSARGLAAVAFAERQPLANAEPYKLSQLLRVDF